MVDEVQKDKSYYWKSPKDGMFYLLRLNSINHQGSYNMFIEDVVHFGYHAPAPLERVGNIKTFHKRHLPFSLDFDRAMLDDLLTTVTISNYYEYQRTIELYFDLYDLLIKHPDVYLKNVDKLFKNKTFKRIMEGEIKRPLT